MCLCSWCSLGTRPQLQAYLPPTYLRELFVTGVNFHPKFTTLQRYAHLFLPLCGVVIYTVNLSTPVLEFSRNKHISSHFVQELRSPTKRPPPKQFLTKHNSRTTKKVLRGLPTKKLRPGSLQWESDALLIHHSVPESGRPMVVLFKFLLTTPFLMKPSVQSHSNSPKN